MPSFLTRMFMQRLNPTALLSTVLLSAALLMAGGCAKDLELLTADEDARQLYERAYTTLHAADFPRAINIFQILESRYPFNNYALQAQLDLAFAYFMFGKNEQAISEADRFIRFNPTHPNVDYAYYVKGLANFGHRKRLFSGWFPRDPAQYNQFALQDSFNNFAELLYRFPNSRYAKDARQRMIYLRNVFAEHEIGVAQFYLEKKAWVAAINRANFVLQHYHATPSNKEALAILVQGYRHLELPEAATNAERVLRFNYPKHPILKVAAN